MKKQYKVAFFKNNQYEERMVDKEWMNGVNLRGAFKFECTCSLGKEMLTVYYVGKNNTLKRVIYYNIYGTWGEPTVI